MPVTIYIKPYSGGCSGDIQYQAMYQYDGKSLWLQLDVTYNAKADYAQGKIDLNLIAFLEHIGLPHIEIFDALKFIPYYKEPTLVEDEEKTFLIIGKYFYSDSYLRVYLNIKTQEVLIDDPNSEDGVVYANSSIVDFKLFMDLYAFQIINYIDKSEEEIKATKPVQWLQNRFSLVDAKALTELNNFWLVFLNSMENYYSG